MNVRLSDAVPPAVAEPEPRLRACAAAGHAASEKMRAIAIIANFAMSRPPAARAASSRVIPQ